MAVSLWLFLADATWTLVGRALRGERLYEAHREHLYQKLAQRWGHAKVTTAIGLGSTALTVAGGPVVAQPGAASGRGWRSASAWFSSESNGGWRGPPGLV